MKRVQQYFLFHDNSGVFTPLSLETVCGRAEGDLRYADDSLMSRKHCRFTIVGTDVYFEAFPSKNPARVNGVPVQPGRRRRIRIHDVIEVGAQRLILTHQDKHTPPNRQFAAAPANLYRGIERTDGSLTVLTDPDVLEHGSELRFEATQVLLDRSTYQKLKVQKQVRRTLVEPIRKHRNRLRWIALAAAVIGAAAFIGWQWGPEPFQEFLNELLPH